MGLFDFLRAGQIKQENEELKKKLADLHADEYYQVKKQLDNMNQEISDNIEILSRKQEELSSLSDQNSKLEKQVETLRKNYYDLKNFIRALSMHLAIS